MRHEAIRKAHPNAVAINGHNDAWDKDDKVITLDETKIAEQLKKLEDQLKATEYQRDRAKSYPELKEQLDLLWHAIDGGKFNVKSKETDFYKKLKAVKDANPKPE